MLWEEPLVEVSLLEEKLWEEPPSVVLVYGAKRLWTILVTQLSSRSLFFEKGSHAAWLTCEQVVSVSRTIDDTFIVF